MSEGNEEALKTIAWFFDETRDLVKELHGKLCDASELLGGLDGEQDAEEIRKALALAVLHALLQPCGSTFVYAPRYVPKWMEGIGLPTAPTPVSYPSP